MLCKPFKSSFACIVTIIYGHPSVLTRDFIFHLLYSTPYSIILFSFGLVFMSYRTIIFDFDGTLCSSITSIASALQHTFIHFGYAAPSMADISRMCAQGPDLKETFLILNPELASLTEKDFVKWGNYYKNTYQKMAAHQCTLFPHVKDMLSQLHQQELELLIVSQKPKDTIVDALKYFKINHFFSDAFGPGGKNPGKPDPYIFEYEILPARPNHQKSDFLMVGDTSVDIQFAINCGIDCAWAEYGYGDLPANILDHITIHLHTPMDLVTQLTSKS